MLILLSQWIQKRSIAIIIITTFASALFLGLFQSVEATDGKNDQINSEIIEAVIFAHSLERQLWEFKEKYTSREQVYDHYRQGFSVELAADMTNYSWSKTTGLVASDYAILPPKTVNVISFDDNNATVYYETPKGLRNENTWGLKKYTIDQLQKEKGRWVISHSMGTDTKPKTP